MMERHNPTLAETERERIEKTIDKLRDEHLERKQTPFGMTLRDYFATHAGQPGIVELADAAGYICNDNFNILTFDMKKVGTFQEWWSGLSNKDRFALTSKVKFQQADAMLQARSKSDG